MIDFCPTISPRLLMQSPIWERFLRQFLFLYYRKEFLEWSDSILVLSSSNFYGSCAARLHEKYSFEWSWRGCKSSGNQESLETILFQPYFTKSNRMLRRNGHMVVFSMITGVSLLKPPPLVKTPWRNIWRFFGGIKTANSNIWENFGGNKTAGGEKIGNWGPVLRILAWKIA